MLKKNNIGKTRDPEKDLMATANKCINTTLVRNFLNVIPRVIKICVLYKV